MLLTGALLPEPVAVRIVDGVVVAVGSGLAAREGEPVVDLGGRFVRHGLRDAHVHFADWARSRTQLDLSGAPSAEAAARAVAAAGTGLPPGAVLRGGGFRAPTWSDEPTAGLLERAAPGRVVILASGDRHSLWLSPAALALAGLGDHPSGLLREHEAFDAQIRLAPPSDAEDEANAAAAVAAATARGVTALRDFDFADPYTVWRRRQHEGGGRLPLRVEAVVQPAQLPAYAARGLRTGDGDSWLRVGPVKLFMDGALGSATARCLTAYAGGTHHGLQLLDPDGLRRALAETGAAGFGVAVHAIGDEATRDALHVLQDAPGPVSVEHAQLLRRADAALFATGQITASVQPAHLLDDAPLVDRLWADTSSVAFPGRLLLDAGARLAFGSDAPVSPLDPWRSIAAAVHRTDGTTAPWHPEEVIDLETALAASGARRPRPGDPADLVVLDCPDPANLSAGDLAAAPVHATFVGGRCVHGPWRVA